VRISSVKPAEELLPDSYHPLAAVSRVHRSGHKKSGPCHSAADFTGGHARGRSYISYITRLSRKEKSSGISGATARQPRPGVVGKTAGQQDQVPGPPPGHGLPDAFPAARAITSAPMLTATGRNCSQQVSRPCLNPLCRGHGTLTGQPGEDREQRAQAQIIGQEHLLGPVSTRRWRPGQLMLAQPPRARGGTRAAQPGIPASRPVLVACPLHLCPWARGQRSAHSDPLLPGGSAPDTVRHCPQGV
jgi:hypothetical protein